MAEPTTAPGGDPPAPATPGQTPPAPASAPQPATVTLSSDRLSQRLAESRTSGTKAVLKSLGFDSEDAAKAALKTLKDLQTSQLSEQEKAAQRIKELEPLATRATTLSSTLAALVEDQFKELPEAARTAIDAVANGDPEQRLALMRVIKAAGGTAPSAAPGTLPPAPKPAPITTTPAPAPAPAPGVKTKFDEWQEHQKRSPMLGDLFYEQNQRAIEQSRPAST